MSDNYRCHFKYQWRYALDRSDINTIHTLAIEILPHSHSHILDDFTIVWAGDRAKLDAFVNRCRRLGYCSQNEPSLTELMDDADDQLFRRIMYNREHVLQPFLPDRPILSYNLRRRPHCNKSLITKTADLSNDEYIIRAIYKDSYWHYS